MSNRQKSHLIHPIVLSVHYVRELMLPIKSITVDTDVMDVLKLFTTQTGLIAVAITDNNNKYLGLITRSHYINLMPRIFAEELFTHSSLKNLLQIDSAIFTSPLIAYVDDHISEVMSDYYNLESNCQTEVLPVMDETGIIGVVKAADMNRKLFESKNALIDDIIETSTRLKDEVNTAASLQQKLLRPGKIDLPGLKGLATLITSSEIGGDFYDYYTVNARWIVMLVGDVSGHGIASGTIVSAAKASVNLLETDKEKEPHKILERLNNTILETARQSLLMTMFVITLDTQSGELRYANAGHQLPYLYRSLTGQLEMLEVSGLPLGKVENISYEQDMTEIDVGDRLFLYSDAIVEEENALGECFGYERLESVLYEHIEGEPENLRDRLLENFSAHTGSNSFKDDVTLFCVEFYERQHFTDKADDLESQEFDLVRIVDSLYRVRPEIILPHIAKQHLVFLADGNFADLMPELASKGVRRILLRHHAITRHLGWDSLLKQHQYYCPDDLARFLNHRRQNWEFQISNSEDKHFIIEELEAWLKGMPLVNPDRVKAAVVLLNQLIDNGIYDAPRNNKNKTLFSKDKPRILEEDELLLLNTSIQDQLLGISLTDNWGTLMPSLFLNCLSQAAPSCGFYTIWRLSDYLQIRVLPHQQTQICVFLDLKHPMDSETDKGFQFLYHTEVSESINQAVAAE